MAVSEWSLLALGFALTVAGCMAAGALRAEGCEVLEKVDESDLGKFGWVMDPEGNKVELWQPPDGQ